MQAVIIGIDKRGDRFATTIGFEPATIATDALGKIVLFPKNVLDWWEKNSQNYYYPVRFRQGFIVVSYPKKNSVDPTKERIVKIFSHIYQKTSIAIFRNININSCLTRDEITFLDKEVNSASTDIASNTTLWQDHLLLFDDPSLPSEHPDLVQMAEDDKWPSPRKAETTLERKSIDLPDNEPIIMGGGYLNFYYRPDKMKILVYGRSGTYGKEHNRQETVNLLNDFFPKPEEVSAIN